MRPEGLTVATHARSARVALLSLLLLFVTACPTAGGTSGDAVATDADSGKVDTNEDSAPEDSGESRPWPCGDTVGATAEQEPWASGFLWDETVYAFGRQAAYASASAWDGFLVESVNCPDAWGFGCSSLIQVYAAPDYEAGIDIATAEDEIIVHLEGHLHSDGTSAITVRTEHDFAWSSISADIYSGSDGSWEATVNAPDGFVADAGWVGDVLVVGSPFWPDASHFGTLAIFPAPLTGELDFEDAAFIHHGIHEGDELGYTFTNVGDGDGDGLDDLVFNAGWSYFLSGTDLLLDEGIGNGAIIRVEQSGGAVTAGDLDGDGAADFTVGDVDVGGEISLQYVSGASLAMNARISDSRPEADVALGYAVGSVGDLDGNGSETLVVSLLRTDSTRSHETFLLDGPLCGQLSYSDAGYQLADDDGTLGVAFAAGPASVLRSQGDGLGVFLWE